MAHGGKNKASRSRSGDFVDARNLAGEDFVAKTLEETKARWGRLGGKYVSYEEAMNHNGGNDNGTA